MGGMKAPFFKTLRDALTGSPDWAALDRGWRESEGLREALEKQLPPPMIEQVLQIRRSDPAQGIRGSQVTVVTTTASAAAKIRLTLADWPNELRREGWGIQSVRVLAQRIQDIAHPDKVRPNRAPIPAVVKQGFAQLSSEVSSEPLRAALSRISRRGKAL